MAGPFVLTLDELLFFLGISLTVGYGLSFLLEKYGVPNVVIYLTTGFVFAHIFLSQEIIQHEQYEFWFRFIETIALGLIGFKIGIELEADLLKQHSKTISIFILFEVFGAFILVFLTMYLLSHSFLLSIILAGLSTATAPAATIEVIRRLKSKGEVTQKLKWILAFDDVVAVVIVEAILSFVIVSTLGHAFTISTFLIEIGREIGLALLIGIVIGFLLDLAIERLGKTFQIMELTLAGLILVMGIAHTLDTSIILACMAVGAVTANREGNNFEQAESYLDIILSPILIVFFLLVGAQIHITNLYDPFPTMAMLYLLARSFGKIGGIYLSGPFANTNDTVRNNLGLGLLPQGGVALGLMAVANDILIRAGMEDLGNKIILTIVISTVFSEGIGAYTTSFGLKRAGEVGKAKSQPIKIDD